jgi:antitoxin CptB
MLENDLILSRFLDSRGAAISEDEIASLDRLLALGDNDLWELLSGHREPADDAVLPLLRRLRGI